MNIEILEDEYNEFLYWKKEQKNRKRKQGRYWLTKEGREELKETFDEYNDGNAILPLLEELERLECFIEQNGFEYYICSEKYK